MDKGNRIIQFNPPNTLEEVQIDQMKEVVDYIIDNAPPEALIDFSKQFLTTAFEEDPDEFQKHYKAYREYIDNHNPGYGQLINFATDKGDDKCQ